MSYFYVCETPCGADYISCPLCNNYRTTISSLNKLCDNINEDNINYINDDSYKCDIIRDNIFDEDNDPEITYCIKCKIIFRLGSVFIERGCTSSTYFAEMVGSFVFKDTLYVGTPIFNSNIHWKKLLINNKIKLNWQSACEKKDVTFIKINDIKNLSNL